MKMIKRLKRQIMAVVLVVLVAPAYADSTDTYPLSSLFLGDLGLGVKSPTGVSETNSAYTGNLNNPLITSPGGFEAMMFVSNFSVNTGVDTPQGSPIYAPNTTDTFTVTLTSASGVLDFPSASNSQYSELDFAPGSTNLMPVGTTLDVSFNGTSPLVDSFLPNPENLAGNLAMTISSISDNSVTFNVQETTTNGTGFDKLFTQLQNAMQASEPESSNHQVIDAAIGLPANYSMAATPAADPPSSAVIELSPPTFVPSGQYLGETVTYTIDPQGDQLVLTNLLHFGFNNVSSICSSGNLMESFSSTLTGNAEIENQSGAIIDNIGPISFNGQVETEVFGYCGSPVDSLFPVTYPTEMLSLTLTGNIDFSGFDPKITIQLNPFDPTIGSLTFINNSIAASNFAVDTEISINGSAPIVQSSNPTSMIWEPLVETTVPEPPILSLMMMGLCLIKLRRALRITRCLFSPAKTFFCLPDKRFRCSPVFPISDR